MKLFRAQEHPHIEIKSKPNARARRLTLRRDARDGQFTVSHPNRISDREIQKFIDQNSQWIAKHHVNVAKVDIGSEIFFRGRPHLIVAGDKRGAHLKDDRIHVRSPNPARAVSAFLKTQAQLFAPPLVDRYAAQLGKNVSALRWRDPKTRWGSCDSNGTIMLSWRLIMAPDDIFDYVIAHEAAHLVEMNHSDRYWAVVDKIYPNHKSARKWLRNEGRALQSLVFQ